MSRKMLREITVDENRKNSFTLPNRGIVRASIPSIEMVKVETVGNVGAQKTVIRHPYMGVNSWIRVCPEVGTPVMTQKRGDRDQLEIWGYISNTNPETITRARESKEFLFRQLYEGETEIMTKGRAYSHWGESADIELRGGTIKQELLQTELEHSGTSPTFSRRLHMHDPSQIGHEERLGVVKRPDSQNPNAFQKYIRDSANEFAVEHSVWLDKKDGTPLSHFQDGHVVNEAGTFQKHSTTNKNLRYIRQWFNSQSGDLRIEVDEELNILVANSSTAREITLNLGTNTKLDINAKSLKETYTTTGNMSFIQSFKLTSPQVAVRSANVTFGSNPVLSLVTGAQNSAVLTPLLNVMSSSLALIAAAPPIAAIPQVAGPLATNAATISGLQSALSGILTQQIKVSG
jgi:hypothetical protein